MPNLYTIIGDPHVTHNSLEKANQLFDLVEKLGNTTIWMGDFLDTKEVIRGKCLNLIYNRLKHSKLMHIILIGNHDLHNLDGTEHSLEVLKSLTNVCIVDSPVSILGFKFIPYSSNLQHLKDTLESTTETVVFGHFDLSGFDYGNGHLCERGLSYDDFSKFEKVISGHFHKYQNKGNFTYIGTPFSHNFGESNQTKYVGLFHTESQFLELIETCFPKHISLEFDETYDPTDPLQTLPELKDSDYLRVIYKGSKETVNILKNYFRWAMGTKILEKVTDTENNNVVLDETSDNKSKFIKWASEIKNLDQDTIKLGLEIMESTNDN